MRRRSTFLAAYAFVASLAAAPLSALAQMPSRFVNYQEQRVPVTWFRATEARGAWPAPGATVSAAALDCVALGEGGGRPIRCAPVALASELSASPSRLSQCLTLREQRPAPAAVATYARTGAPIAGTILFVRRHTHQTEEVRGPCRRQGIDACMGVPGPVIGRRVLRLVEHEVMPDSPELHADAFDPIHGTAPWLAPVNGDWPARPESETWDEAPLVARTAESNTADVRFAAWVDLVAARLLRRDVDAARGALDHAAELATTLTGTPFVAPDISRNRTAAEIDALANSSDPIPARHAMLRALLGARMFEAADLQRAVERARDLRNRITPAATLSRVFFQGEDPRTYVPTVLGALHHLTHQELRDPCAPAVSP